MRIKMVSKHASGIVRLTHRWSYNLAHSTSHSASHNCIYCIHTPVSCCMAHQSILDLRYNNFHQQWLALSAYPIKPKEHLCDYPNSNNRIFTSRMRNDRALFLRRQMRRSPLRTVFASIWETAETFGTLSMALHSISHLNFLKMTTLHVKKSKVMLKGLILT